MSMLPFNGADPSSVVALLHRGCPPEQVISLQFRSPVWPRRSSAAEWLRLQAILAVPEVYSAFGIQALPKAMDFSAACGLEVIGTLANLLNRHSLQIRFVQDVEQAIIESRRYLDVFFQRNYYAAEAYSCREAWCDWFHDERVLAETILIGNGTEWWLIAVTASD